MFQEKNTDPGSISKLGSFGRKLDFRATDGYLCVVLL